jgi:hypothetical protein
VERVLGHLRWPPWHRNLYDHERGAAAERVIGHLRWAVIRVSISALICFVFL